MSNQFVLSQTPFTTLLESWETNVSDFLTFMITACGVKEESDTFQVLQANIKSEKDIEKFVEFFDGNLDNIKNTTRLYQESLVH